MSLQYIRRSTEYIGPDLRKVFLLISEKLYRIANMDEMKWYLLSLSIHIKCHFSQPASRIVRKRKANLIEAGIL